MPLRPLYAPLRPDLDAFLFATVGAEHDGAPLSMLSVMTRLGLDPWEEAGRLSLLGKRDAVEQLRQLIGRLPEAIWPTAEASKISAALIDLLPKRDRAPHPVKITRADLLFQWVPAGMFWPLCCVLGAVAIVIILARGGFPFGN